MNKLSLFDSSIAVWSRRHPNSALYLQQKYARRSGLESGTGRTRPAWTWLADRTETPSPSWGRNARCAWSFLDRTEWRRGARSGKNRGMWNVDKLYKLLIINIHIDVVIERNWESIQTVFFVRYICDNQLKYICIE